MRKRCTGDICMWTDVIEDPQAVYLVKQSTDKHLYHRVFQHHVLARGLSTYMGVAAWL